MADIIGEVDWKEVSASLEAVDDVSFTNNVDSRSYGHMGYSFFLALFGRNQFWVCKVGISMN